MEELKLTGNHLKGSRPLITFSSNFGKEPRWLLMKEMITQVHLFICLTEFIFFLRVFKTLRKDSYGDGCTRQCIQ